MSDPVVSGLVERLLIIVEKHVGSEIKLVTGLKKEIRKLSIVLKNIQSVINDAEKRRIEEEAVKDWLEMLENVAYEMDDVLDEFETAILKNHVGVTNNDVSVPEWKVGWINFKPFSCFRQVKSRRDIAVRIKDLNSRLDFIDKEKGRFNFLQNTNSFNIEYKRVETTSLVNESMILGRDSDKKSLVNTLLSEDCKEVVDVVAIVGTGGVGKTSLAQLAFNCVSVANQFDHRIWVCVSDPFDEIQVARKIIESLCSDELLSGGMCSLESLARRIHDFVSGKRVLLVLDDVWPHESMKWEQLKICFKNVASGSKVVVTTRDVRVARNMFTAKSNIHQLNQLSDDDCWLLVRGIALSHSRVGDAESFEHIGRQVSRKCKGLPLAAKILGKILLFEERVEQWQEVLDSKIWELETIESELFPHLYLSYCQLPPAMRRCLKYCAVFPKDEKIDVSMLIRMWIAQGYLTSMEDQNLMEHRGYQYVEHISTISLFQDLKKDVDGRILSCKMHDIVHDFVQYLMKNESAMIEITDARLGLKLPRYKTCRHVSWLSPSSEDKHELTTDGYQTVRTLSASRCSIPSDLFIHLKCVRVLMLVDCGLDQLPDNIGSLIHLRYLDLSRNKITKLPVTICDLFNLQSLYLRFCFHLIDFPQKIEKLINLRHLIIDHSRKLLLPEGIVMLTGLQTLSELVIGKGNKLRYLNKLNQLGRSLRIIIGGDNDQLDVFDAMQAELRNKSEIRQLRLDIRNDVEWTVIDALHVPPNLNELEIYIRRGHCFPRWMTTSLDNLRHLVFSPGKNCLSLPPLWKLQSLETLEIRDNKAIKHLRLEFFGIQRFVGSSDRDSYTPSSSSLPIVAFPKMKRLCFTRCENWKRWEDVKPDEEPHLDTIMPCLQQLVIEDCYELRELPLGILRPSKERLVVWQGCPIEGFQDCQKAMNRSKKAGAMKEMMRMLPGKKKRAGKRGS